ncbi:MAG: spore cortex-lytic protein [Oscillospiraceae bacterium]|nr:spore cortex-lytic protein [Oscillospiraceae bacterium]
MNATGYITVHAYTSNAQLPLKDVAITVTASDGTAIAMRLTDRNGQIDPIVIPVPARSASLSPGLSEAPFTAVNLYARLRGYEQIEIENLQVFADTTTNQNLEMIPLSELPGRWDQTEIFDTTRQNL